MWEHICHCFFTFQIYVADSLYESIFWQWNFIAQRIGCSKYCLFVIFCHCSLVFQNFASFECKKGEISVKFFFACVIWYTHFWFEPNMISSTFICALLSTKLAPTLIDMVGVNITYLNIIYDVWLSIRLNNVLIGHKKCGVQHQFAVLNIQQLKCTNTQR